MSTTGEVTHSSANFGVTTLISQTTKAFLKWVGIDLLTKAQTESYLNDYQLSTHAEQQILLPSVTDIVDPTKIIFPERIANTIRSYVWLYETNGKNATMGQYGGVRAGDKTLCTDFNNRDFLSSIFSSKKRRLVHTPSLIAPWSQFVDGTVFGGYYDYVMLIAAKLCRIKDALPKHLFEESVISYPLFNTPYEEETLSLLGFKPERVLDSQLVNVTFRKCILANSGDWLYPNQADVLSLRKHIGKAAQPASKEGERIYISRAGRRRIQNEKTLISLLKRYGFQIINDIPRSIVEQVNMYRNASFIMGPHGASFTNILWCNPDTHLFELFSPNYIPDYFPYLATILGMRYSAYCYGAPATDSTNGKALSDDIFVSIHDIEQALNTVLT